MNGSATCSSKRARWALLRASFLNLGSARYTWFSLFWSLVMCVLGWWGVHVTLDRYAAASLENIKTVLFACGVHAVASLVGHPMSCSASVLLPGSICR